MIKIDENDPKIRRIVYGACLVISLFLTFMAWTQYKLKISSLAKGKKTDVTLIGVSCTESSRGRSSVWFSYNGKRYSVNVSYLTCLKYNSGDHLEVLYNPDYDLFVTENLDLNEQRIGLVAGLIASSAFLMCLFFPFLFKKRDKTAPK